MTEERRTDGDEKEGQIGHVRHLWKEKKKRQFNSSHSSSCLLYLELSFSSVLLLVISFPLLHTVHTHTCHMWGG